LSLTPFPEIPADSRLPPNSAAHQGRLQPALLFSGNICLRN
jgi:hypothetical protein